MFALNSVRGELIIVKISNWTLRSLEEWGGVRGRGTVWDGVRGTNCPQVKEGRAQCSRCHCGGFPWAFGNSLASEGCLSTVAFGYTYVWEFSVFFLASKTAASVWERQLPLRSIHVPQPSEVSQASALVVSEVQEIARRASGSVPLPF